MVIGLKKLLAQARLVELTDEEKANLGMTEGEVSPDAETTVAAAAPAEPVPPPPASAESAVAEGHPLEEIYAQASLPGCAFPAERLLRLLDGLRAMDPATRKAAVQAMDAADETWEISDPVRDAERKITAIEGHKKRLAEQVEASEQNAAASIAGLKSTLEQTTGEIRRQIAELEQLLEREVTRSAQETTSIDAELRATRERAARETRRLDTEIERLREIPAYFATPVART